MKRSIPQMSILPTSKEWTPEQELWAEVLLTVPHDLGRSDNPKLMKNKKHRKRIEELIDWVKSEEPNVPSFTWICDQLGIDPDSARERILSE